MNADRLVWWVRDWLNSRISHRDICVHLRSSAAKIPFFLIRQSQPNATRQGPGPGYLPPATPGPIAAFKPFRTDLLNREPTAKPGPTVPFKPSRTDLLNHELTAKPGPTAPFKPFRTDPLNREPTAKPGATAPRVAGSNAFSAAVTAQPARAIHPIAPLKRRAADAPAPQFRASARSVRLVPRSCSRGRPTRALPDRPTGVLTTHGAGRRGQRWRDALRGGVRW
jgi:hypothetical protein